jgi:hypothetical protein
MVFITNIGFRIAALYGVSFAAASPAARGAVCVEELAPAPANPARTKHNLPPRERQPKRLFC